MGPTEDYGFVYNGDDEKLRWEMEEKKRYAEESAKNKKIYDENMVSYNKALELSKQQHKKDME